MWCGERFCEVESKHGFRINPGLLLADRAFQLGPNPYESDKTICYACITKLKSPSIALTITNSAPVLSPINDDEITLAEDLGDRAPVPADPNFANLDAPKFTIEAMAVERGA